jgi:iron complex outermembrane receptor protein
MSYRKHALHFFRSTIGYTPRLCLTAIAAVMVVAPQIAQAQLEEIVVTATRRAETDMQTTPVSVSVVTASEFDKLFANDIGEIASYVPNFSAATITGFNAASFAMRGAAETDIIVYFDPKVGVIVDDFVIPHVQTQLLEPFDIEAVEVLRGPQGTLFGKNTTAGALVVRTKQPSLEGSESEASLSLGSFSDVKAKFATNQPLSDNVAFRFAGMYQKNDGYYRNGKVDTPIDAFGAGIGDAAAANGTTVAGDGRSLGGKDVFSGRAKLLWEATENTKITAQVEIIRDRSESVPVVNVTPAGAGQLATLFGFPGVPDGVDPIDFAGIHGSDIVKLDEGQEVDVFGTYVNFEHVLENHTLYGLVGYREQESRLPNEYLGTAYESFFAATRDDDRETFQAETRIASNFGGAFNYVAGLFYQTNDVDFCVLQQLGLTEFFGSANPGVLDNKTPLLLCNRQEAESLAGFVDFTYDVSDKFQIGAGVRLTKEEKDYTARAGLPISFIFPGGLASINEPLDGADFNQGAAFVQRDSDSWTEPTWRFTGSYQFNDDVFGYATVSRGFKSGGYNDQAGSGGFDNFPLQSYQPEFATNIEVGVKTNLADDRVRFNVTAFSVNYEDFQRSTVVSIPGTAFQETRTFNAADVDAQGLELEITAALSKNLTLRANIGLLDTEYNEFLLDRNLDGILEDFSGRTVVRSPEVTAGVDLTYMQTLNAGGDIRWNLNYNHEDENTYYYNDDIGSDFDTVLEARDIINASVTWTDTDDRYRVSIYGKNLTDDRYKTASQAVGALWTFASYGAPVSYGIEFGANF